MAFLLALITWVGVWLSSAGDSAVSSMQSPFALGVTAVALPIAIGLWLRKQWAYWLGLIAAGWQFVSHALFLIVAVLTDRRLGVLDWLFELVLAAFLVVLLLPATRRGCRPSPTPNE
jgi:TRAP-type uncharacterized transport system fused permease subunit